MSQPVNATLSKVVDPTNNLNKETNPDTGWSYHGARWMMPQTARWTAPDPAVKLTFTPVATQGLTSATLVMTGAPGPEHPLPVDLETIKTGFEKNTR